MNIKLKAFLLSLGILLSMFAGIYLLVFHTGVILLLALVGLVYSLYRLILNALQEKERRKKP